MVMKAICVAAGLLVASTAVAQAQSGWTGRLEAGYATSTNNTSSGLGGGSFGGSAFVGRELNHWLALGAELGFYRVRDETTVTAVGCNSPGTPGALECTSVRDDQNRWIQTGVTLLMSPTRGTWRPHASVGLGAWFAKGTNTIDIVVNATGESEPGFPTSSSSDAFALGASLGAGLDWSPGDGPWSVGLGGRIHLLEGGNSFGD
jgi:opacity protein-like surface antigen